MEDPAVVLVLGEPLVRGDHVVQQGGAVGYGTEGGHKPGVQTLEDIRLDLDLTESLID